MMNWRKAVFLLLACLLSGCASRPQMPAPADRNLWARHESSLASLQAWDMQGRISVQIHREAWSAGLRWLQNGADYRIQLIAPLGQGAFELSGGQAGVILEGEGRRLTAEEPERLLEEALGWHVPVRGMKYWIRGIPMPGPLPFESQIDEAGRLSKLQQDGWTIDYRRYSDHGPYTLPARLDMGNPEHDLSIRLVLRKWEHLQ